MAKEENKKEDSKQTETEKLKKGIPDSEIRKMESEGWFVVESYRNPEGEGKLHDLRK